MKEADDSLFKITHLSQKDAIKIVKSWNHEKEESLKKNYEVTSDKQRYEMIMYAVSNDMDLKKVIF